MLLHLVATARLEDLAKQVYRSEGKLPEQLENAPELLPGLYLYLQAFFNLHYERPSGEILMPIPWSKIKAYGEWLDLDDVQMDRLHVCIRTMDDKFLEVKNAPAVAEAKKARSPLRPNRK